MQKPTITIDVISDVVCPWCYIGKRRLEKAMNQLADQYDFEVTYHPFELNPQMPKSGANQKEYLTKKFGSEQRYQQITQHVSEVAATEGITFNFEKQAVAPNTRMLQAIISEAKNFNKQEETKEAFLKAYFTDGVDLSKKENIISVTKSVGLTSDFTEAVLSDPTASAKVEAAENHLYKLGITGVPFYIINNQQGLSGAQPTSVFVEVFEHVHAATSLGDACDVEGKNC